MFENCSQSGCSLKASSSCGWRQNLPLLKTLYGYFCFISIFYGSPFFPGTTHFFHCQKMLTIWQSQSFIIIWMAAKSPAIESLVRLFSVQFLFSMAPPFFQAPPSSENQILYSYSHSLFDIWNEILTSMPDTFAKLNTRA